MYNLIGSGSYGCVTNKSITKKALIYNYVAGITRKEFNLSEKQNKHISKIFADKEDYCKELVIITTILYKYHEKFNNITFFSDLSTIPKRCSTYSLINIENVDYHNKKKKVLDTLQKFFNEKPKKIIDSNKNDSISQCLINKFDNNIHNVELYELVYNFDGIPLTDIKINDYDFINAFIIFCKSLETFHQLQFIHRDIKGNNILYNDTNNKLSLIDFGLSIRADELYSDKEKWYIESDYFISPPEFRILNSNKYGNLEELNSIYKNERFYNKKKKEYDEFFNNYHNVYDIPDNIKNNSHKGDIYALGLTFLLLYSDNNIVITHNDKNLINNMILNLIENMIKTNPLERYNLYDVIIDLFAIQKYYKFDDSNNFIISCDKDIAGITKTLSTLTIKGGKYTLKKKKIKKIKKPIKKLKSFQKFI